VEIRWEYYGLMDVKSFSKYLLILSGKKGAEQVILIAGSLAYFENVYRNCSRSQKLGDLPCSERRLGLRFQRREGEHLLGGRSPVSLSGLREEIPIKKVATG
jgi:hypothetical protein